METNKASTVHERDERWDAVDAYAKQHLHDSATPFAKALDHALKLSDEAGLDTPIAVSALQGTWLALQCRLLNVKHALEVGTLGGYSSMWLASASPDIQVTTIEIDPKAHASAQKAHAHAGLSDRIECLLGPGVDVLKTITKDVEQGKREKFGFVFIDADKPNNVNYLNAAIELCLPNACIVVDNVVRRGQVAYPERAENEDQRARVEGSRLVIEAAGKDDRLVGATVVQTVGEKNYDGFMMCVVK